MTGNKELDQAIVKIEEKARENNLDFFPTEFRLVPAFKMYEFGAYGLPGRFSHWTHGKAYYQMKTMYDYGLSKIYELVINTNPAFAFLLENNDVLQNQVIAAHVFAHVDFFKNNVYFQHSDRRMINMASIHAERIKQYEQEYGFEAVENWLDLVLTIQANFETIPRQFQQFTAEEYIKKSREETERRLRAKDSPSSKYDDILELGKPKKEAKKADITPPIPYENEHDLLWLIAEFSPLQLHDYQKDILYMVRAEQQYFLPQMQTKIMNEGWAAYWHARIMREMDLTDSEAIDFASMHAGVVSPGRKNSINPYFIGMKIFEDIQRKFEGKPHPEDTIERNWLDEEIDPKKLEGNTNYDIFRVREEYNDLRFLRDYLADYLIADLDLYIYSIQGDKWAVTDKDPESVRNQLVSSLVNFGQPVIYVPEAGYDYDRNRELYLKHSIDDRELDIERTKKTLKTLFAMWGRPVHLETMISGSRSKISCINQDKVDISKL